MIFKEFEEICHFEDEDDEVLLKAKGQDRTTIAINLFNISVWRKSFREDVETTIIEYEDRAIEIVVPFSEFTELMNRHALKLEYYEKHPDEFDAFIKGLDIDDC